LQKRRATRNSFFHRIMFPAYQRARPSAIVLRQFVAQAILPVRLLQGTQPRSIAQKARDGAEVAVPPQTETRLTIHDALTSAALTLYPAVGAALAIPNHASTIKKILVQLQRSRL
jgi:hypothetical protein